MKQSLKTTIEKPQSMSKTVAQYIIDRLAQEVDHAFCFVGGASIFLTDALNNSSVKPIFCLHEQACGVEAEAYGQYTNKLALAIVTAGPGTLNILNPVCAANFDSTPMIVLSGQANSFHLSGEKLRTKGIQEVKTEKIVRSIVKDVYTCLDEKDVPYLVEKAIWQAKNNRKGVVWLDIPLDIQSKIIEKNGNFDYININNRQPPDFSFVDKLMSSKNPVIFVGNGVRLSGAESFLVKILEKLKIPVLTTWRAMDLFEESHQLYVGRPGAIGQRGANTTLQTCDFLLCLGTRLDLPSVAFNYANFAPLATKVIVDIDEAEIDKLGLNKIKIIADLKDFCEKFYQYILDNNLEYENPQWLKKCKELHGQPIYKKQSDELSLYEFIEKITPFMKNKTIALGSSGSISEVFCQSFKVPAGCRIIQSNGLGSMGFGLPAAIGSHYASGKPVVMLDGDGSFAMNSQELSLVSAKKLPISMIIINNNGYNSIKNTQENICGNRQFGTNSDSGLYLPNYKKMAESYDLPYYKIDKEFIDSVFDEEIGAILNCGPSIIEVFTDSNHKTQCRTISKKLPDGTMSSSKLEDLS